MIGLPFLRRVQQSGWRIESVDGDTCTVRCPRAGCDMRARFRAALDVPPRNLPLHSLDEPVRSFDDARALLKARREELGLTIAEVEHVSGIADDHLAKCERTAFDKMPNVQTFMEWAQALGFDVILRPAELPPVVLRVISETRDKLPARRRRFEIERAKDAARRK